MVAPAFLFLSRDFAQALGIGRSCQSQCHEPKRKRAARHFLYDASEFAGL
jgi:hypothetical protein